jgi:nucleotide-binding universal stress UspA family protein
MIQNILVGVDGSSCCATAADLAARWGRRAGAAVVGLGVLDRPKICKPEPEGIWGSWYKQHHDKVLLGDARQRLDEALQGFARRCASAGVACEIQQAVGDPARQILRKSQNYGLILLGRETAFHFQPHWPPDHTLETVLHRAPRAVVAVPREPPKGRSVVVAYDGSPPAARALEACAAWKLDEGQPVYVLSVGNEDEARRRADEAVGVLRSSGVQAVARPLASHAAPARLILEQSAELDARLLVMGAYGRARLAEFLFGSTTNAVLRKSECLLLLHH